MRSVLFLGNSHVSAYKLAYEKLGLARNIDCRFYCGRAADLVFTRVSAHGISQDSNPKLDPEILCYGYSDISLDWSIEQYITLGRPLEDVAQQFLNTGGSESIQLDNIEAIFYVVGTSPFDFVRLRSYNAPTTEALRGFLLDRVLKKKFLLKQLINDIKKEFPLCRHYFIGVPLRSEPKIEYSSFVRSITLNHRSIVYAMRKNYLFDDVFMPPSELLDDSLLTTKSDYNRGGGQDAINFQKFNTVDPAPKYDAFHMNSTYASVVFEQFVLPCLAGIESCKPQHPGLGSRLLGFFKSTHG